ncbi:TPA: FidL-like protein [Enterobacter hormaechei subsp. xiangfangensis]
MNNPIKKPLVLLLLIMLLSVLGNAIYFYLNRGDRLDVSCVSVLRTHEYAIGFKSTETATLVMSPNHSGYISFSGKVFYENKTMQFFREIRFNYHKEGDGNYKIFDINTFKHPSDNAPDALIDSVFFSTSQEKSRFMNLTKIYNAYVIGNLHSPVFMCIVK